MVVLINLVPLKSEEVPCMALTVDLIFLIYRLILGHLLSSVFLLPSFPLYNLWAIWLIFWCLRICFNLSMTKHWPNHCFCLLSCNICPCWGLSSAFVADSLFKYNLFCGHAEPQEALSFGFCAELTNLNVYCVNFYSCCCIHIGQWPWLRHPLPLFQINLSGI